MSSTLRDAQPKNSSDSARQIDIGLTLSVSGPGEVEVRRRVALPVEGRDLAAMETRLTESLDRELKAIRRISRLLLRIAEWRSEMQPEFDLLVLEDVAMKLRLESEESRLSVEFVAEYVAADLKPLVHKVSFPVTEKLPSIEEVLERLDNEWKTLRRVFTIAHGAGSGAVTRAVPPPFLESRREGAGPSADRDVQLRARAATPEEAKKAIERYLDNFHFPFEVEEKGVRYGFIPRVEISEGRAAIQLTVTVLIPPASGQVTFMKGGSKSVVVPISEIYVQGEELNRKTKEGFLEIIKGLCRTLGRERGLSGEIDITRPR